MILSNLFKNTNYGDSRFSGAGIEAVNARMSVKQVKDKETPYITCFVRNKEIKLTPEEVVRQLYIYFNLRT
jgi:type I restriction enzyme M protein